MNRTSACEDETSASFTTRSRASDRPIVNASVPGGAVTALPHAPPETTSRRSVGAASFETAAEDVGVARSSSEGKSDARRNEGGVGGGSPERATEEDATARSNTCGDSETGRVDETTATSFSFSRSPSLSSSLSRGEGAAE